MRAKLTRTRQNLITSLEQKFPYKDIQKYTDICFQSPSRMQFLGVKKWDSTFFFLTPNKNMFYGKRLCQKGFLFVAGPYYFQCRPRERQRERERAVSLMLQVWSLATYEPIKCQCCTVNQLTGFYMRETLVLNGFKMGSATSQ